MQEKFGLTSGMNKSGPLLNPAGHWISLRLIWGAQVLKPVCLALNPCCVTISKWHLTSLCPEFLTWKPRALISTPAFLCYCQNYINPYYKALEIATSCHQLFSTFDFTVSLWAPSEFISVKHSAWFLGPRNAGFCFDSAFVQQVFIECGVREGLTMKPICWSHKPLNLQGPSKGPTRDLYYVFTFLTYS